MKLKFWQKTYLLTLLIFLIFLNAGVFTLGYMTYLRDLSAEQAGAEAEARYIAKSFLYDCEALREYAGGEVDLQPPAQAYVVSYRKEGVCLSFRSENGTLASSFADGLEITEPGVYFQKCGEEDCVIVAQTLDGGLTMLCGRSIEALKASFRRLTFLYAGISAGISALLAAALFFLLRKLSAPLEKLRRATERIAEGDYSVKAAVGGQDEFSTLAASFNAMVDRISDQMEDLKRSSDEKQRLVDNMAHELRTPLTAIYGNAEYLRRANTTEEEKIDSAVSIMAEADRLRKISEKLLDTAYIRKNEIARERVELEGLLQSVMDRTAAFAGAREVGLKAEARGAVVEGDETLLGVLFGNLTENAVKACKKGGRVTLTAATEESGVSVYVADNGRGMTEEQIAHITEPFYRTDRSRSRADGGAGLGLALCKAICDAHAAEMSFDSVLCGGTTVRVFFPQKQLDSQLENISPTTR